MISTGVVAGCFETGKIFAKITLNLRSHLRIYMSSHVDLAIKQSAPIYTRNDLPTNTPTAGWNIQKKKQQLQQHVCFKVIDCFLLPPSLLFKKNMRSYQHDVSQSRKPTRHLIGPVSDIAIFGVSDLRANGLDSQWIPMTWIPGLNTPFEK